MIEIDYLLSGDGDADCECSHDVSYTLMGVKPGTWLVKAEGVSTTVTVD